jgi:hypothetical protein
VRLTDVAPARCQLQARLAIEEADSLEGFTGSVLGIRVRVLAAVVCNAGVVVWCSCPDALPGQPSVVDDVSTGVQIILVLIR